MRFVKALPFCLALALAACHGREAATAAGSSDAPPAEDTAALPKPAPTGGPVTGMPPKPGPGPVGVPEAVSAETEPTLPPEAALAGDADQAPATSATQPDAAATGAPTPAGGSVDTATNEPTPEDAAALVRSYYDALGARDFARAHALWSEGGSASGHSVGDLAAEYADTAALAVDVGAPGRMDAAAGSRYLKVPVALTRTLRDGSVQRAAGTVALRRSVVDGATPDQRAWRIAWTDLRAAPAQ